MKRTALPSFLLICLGACSPAVVIHKDLAAMQEKLQDHVGFALYDPESHRTIIEFNSNQYFTPASNTKILTFYTALQILGDTVPALRYTVRNDSLIFWGTGDPSFLYPAVERDQKVFHFLKDNSYRLFFSPANFSTEHFGPGWAWDDFTFDYSCERSPFPIYGNRFLVSFPPQKSPRILPDFFKDQVTLGISPGDRDPEIKRDVSSNKTFVNKGSKDTTSVKIPFHSSPELLARLLSDTLKKSVGLVSQPRPGKTGVVWGIPSDSLYRVMMQASDNFIAEQLLLLCADAVSDSLKPEIAIRYSKKKFLFDLPDPVSWVDGSGLSRYNLATPRSLIRVWEKILNKVPKERLLKLLAVGGESGTLKNWYRADKPFIYGKTGSLSNNHSLSGFIITKKNKVLIFSFMNANFVTPSSEVRKSMQDILASIRSNY
jgi:serine-type D-Ala-D-Ala carboxypeptidase/endopeptidase (penicillin-binding protein 4)